MVCLWQWICDRLLSLLRTWKPRMGEFVKWCLRWLRWLASAWTKNGCWKNSEMPGYDDLRWFHGVNEWAYAINLAAPLMIPPSSLSQFFASLRHSYARVRMDVAADLKEILSVHPQSDKALSFRWWEEQWRRWVTPNGLRSGRRGKPRPHLIS